MAYFNGLSTKPGTLSALEEHWQQIEGMDLSPSQHSAILHLASHAATSAPSYKDRRTYTNLLRKRIGLWLPRLPNTIEHGEPQHVVDARAGLHRLRVRPTADVLEQMDRHLDANLTDYTLTHMAHYLRTSASFTHMPGDHVLGRVGKIVHDIPGIMPLESYAMIYWAAAMLEAVADKHLPFSRQVHGSYVRAYDYHFAALGKDEGNQRYASQIRSAALWFTGGNLGIVDLKRDEKTSPWEIELRNDFANAGHKLVTGDRAKIAELDKQMDITFSIDKRIVHLEADGDSHFQTLNTAGDHAYSGENVFNMRLEQKLRPQDNFIHLTHTDWTHIIRRYGWDYDQITKDIYGILKATVTQANINKHGSTIALRDTKDGLVTMPVNNHGTLSLTF